MGDVREDFMGNIVRSFLDELVPRWVARRALSKAREPAEPRQIVMPTEVPMAAKKEPGPYRPKPQPSHWRAPNM
jgi:hypothetical protein